MRITDRQLRQIIREEMSKSRTRLHETSHDYWEEKLRAQVEEEEAYEEGEAWAREEERLWNLRNSPRIPPVAARGRLGAPPVEIRKMIMFYTTTPRGREAWDLVARDDYEGMAHGGDPSGTRQEFYSNWNDQDFQTVINSLSRGTIR